MKLTKKQLKEEIKKTLKEAEYSGNSKIKASQAVVLMRKIEQIFEEAGLRFLLPVVDHSNLKRINAENPNALVSKKIISNQIHTIRTNIERLQLKLHKLDDKVANIELTQNI